MVSCVANELCTPSDNPCHRGMTSCATGTSVCLLGAEQMQRNVLVPKRNVHPVQPRGLSTENGLPGCGDMQSNHGGVHVRGRNVPGKGRLPRRSDLQSDHGRVYVRGGGLSHGNRMPRQRHVRYSYRRVYVRGRYVSRAHRMPGHGDMQ
jgi:hypothetical protein